MGYWHFDDLRNALEAKGWRIVAEHGAEAATPGSWEIQRSTLQTPLFIDFESGWGPDGLTLITLPQSYGCHVRDHRELSLYFSKQHKWHDRKKWKEDLCEFMTSLDAMDVERRSEANG